MGVPAHDPFPLECPPIHGRTSWGYPHTIHSLLSVLPFMGGPLGGSPRLVKDHPGRAGNIRVRKNEKYPCRAIRVDFSILAPRDIFRAGCLFFFEFGTPGHISVVYTPKISGVEKDRWSSGRARGW